MISIWREVYPRVGGGNQLRPSSRVSRLGLSPRGRGKPQASIEYLRDTRSIPAWAGETSWSRKGNLRRMVYPRVGGGNANRLVVHSGNSGLSPRGRGKQVRTIDTQRGMRSIPAWAGETGYQCPAPDKSRVYPRVGGGNRTSSRWRFPPYGLSPRGRGKPKPIFRAIR